MDARTTALATLIACRKQGAWADGALKEQLHRSQLSRRDAALATRLVYGVIQNKMRLDFQLQSLVKSDLKKLQPVVLDILRLGLYQITDMDKIPTSAAVNEAVEQGKKYAGRAAAGLINGVLRNAARHKEQLPQPKTLAVRYSHPEPLVTLLREAVGEELLEPLLSSHNELAPVVIQRNPLAISEADFLAALREAEAEASPHPWQKDAWILTHAGSLSKLPLFARGGFYVQDPAARLSVTAAGLAPGMRVLDVCAAPGGKSFAAAIDMEDTGSIVSCDIHPHKIELLAKGAARLGLHSITPCLQDGSAFRPDFEKAMDAVLCDVPCSGLGVIRKKPDIREKPLDGLARLPEVQGRILENASRYVRPGGVLLYSTCTILPRENQGVVDAFLACHGDFHKEPFPVPAALGAGNDGAMTLLPPLHGTDGFFICKLRRDT